MISNIAKIIPLVEIFGLVRRDGQPHRADYKGYHAKKSTQPCTPYTSTEGDKISGFTGVHYVLAPHISSPWRVSEMLSKGGNDLSRC
jgi:hypothetical protein